MTCMNSASSKRTESIHRAGPPPGIGQSGTAPGIPAGLEWNRL